MKEILEEMTLPAWLTLRNLVTIVFLLAMFFLGRALGKAAHEKVPTAGLVSQVQNWGLGFGESGTQPTGNVSADKLAEYDAYYVGDAEDKVIYLTFDAGFENGNTEPILDALKKHNAKGTFFVVGHYLESAPDLVKRMVEEAEKLGADAVINMRYGSSSVMQGAAEVIAYGMKRILIICTTYCLCGIMDVIVGSIRGLGYAITPMIVSLLGVCAFRVVWIFTVFRWERSLETLYISYPVSWFMTAAVHLTCFLIVRKRLAKRLGDAV